MIKYRPHKGLLTDSMTEMQSFNDIAEMLKWISEYWHNIISPSNIVISESYGIDERIGWNSWRYVCTTRISNEKYDTPQCIGMCDLGEND